MDLGRKKSEGTAPSASVAIMEMIGVRVVTRTIGGEAQPTVDARELHRISKSRVPFSLWMHSIVCRRKLGTDFEVAQDVPEGKHVRKVCRDYHMTTEMALYAVMIDFGAVGRQVRDYLIDREKLLRRVAPAQADAVLGEFARDLRRVAPEMGSADRRWLTELLGGELDDSTSPHRPADASVH